MSIYLNGICQDTRKKNTCTTLCSLDYIIEINLKVRTGKKPDKFPPAAGGGEVGGGGRGPDPRFFTQFSVVSFPTIRPRNNRWKATPWVCHRKFPIIIFMYSLFYRKKSGTRRKIGPLVIFPISVSLTMPDACKVTGVSKRGCLGVRVSSMCEGSYACTRTLTADTLHAKVGTCWIFGVTSSRPKSQNCVSAIFGLGSGGKAISKIAVKIIRLPIRILTGNLAR